MRLACGRDEPCRGRRVHHRHHRGAVGADNGAGGVVAQGLVAGTAVLFRLRNSRAVNRTAAYKRRSTRSRGIVRGSTKMSWPDA